MRLNLNANGNIPATYPAVWYRVSTWARDCFVADFDNRAEAEQFAIEDSGKGNFDHKVATMKLTREMVS